MTMQGMMAAGHIYNPTTKTGLLMKFESDTLAEAESEETLQKNRRPRPGPGLGRNTSRSLAIVQLWQTGNILATTEVINSPTGTEAGIGQARNSEQFRRAWQWDYFYNLRFLADFPQVTHWWFGSSWTGKVRLSQPTGAIDTTTVGGLMQFIDEEVPGMPWMLTDGNPVLVHTPMPPFEVRASNLPLRLALAQLVIGLIQGDVAANEWQLVTSLVEREQLAQVFPTTFQPWQLETLQNVASLPLREMLCLMQGLTNNQSTNQPTKRKKREEGGQS